MKYLMGMFALAVALVCGAALSYTYTQHQAKIIEKEVSVFTCTIDGYPMFTECAHPDSDYYIELLNLCQIFMERVGKNATR
jgi:hypothetical protein